MTGYTYYYIYVRVCVAMGRYGKYLTRQSHTIIETHATTGWSQEHIDRAERDQGWENAPEKMLICWIYAYTDMKEIRLITLHIQCI